jgi:hypothetical protein
MAANSALNITSLDFDTLKSNLRTFMKSQSTFKDYDFEGSNINVLLDVMAYNTYINSFYTNMAISEMFLDSAQVRDSVVSHAKQINYLPASRKSPEALIDVTFKTNGIGTTFLIPKGTQFSGTNANGAFVFTTDRNHTALSTSGNFTFSNLPIYEGTYISEVYIVDYTNPNQKFLVTNYLVDTDSMTVDVYENNGMDVTSFTQESFLYDLKPTSNIYFLQAASRGTYEIMFGDGVFGRIPQNASTVVISYRVSAGSGGSGIDTFFIDKDLGPVNGGAVTGTTITTVSKSSNGAERESIESIRFRAPRAFQTLGRAVTASDYRNLIIDNFNEVKDVHVYGGETIADSVQYGKVFISPSTYSGAPLTNQRKTDLVYFLDNKKILNIQNIVIDPEYIYIIPTINVNVNFNNTTLSPAQISTKVVASATKFNNDYLEMFNTTFRFSKFTETIDSTDSSIVGNQITTQAYKVVQPPLGLSSSISTIFNNRLIPGTVYSSNFLLSDGNTYQITDYNPNVNSFVRGGTGNVFDVQNTNPVLYLKYISSNNTEYYTVIGSVDYMTGKISVGNIYVVDFLGNIGIQFFAITYSDDITAYYNNVIELDIGSMVVNVMAVN